VRRAALLLALLAGCSDDAAPPLPAGALKIDRAGILRAGAAEASDPERLLAARAAEGAVSVDVDADTPVDGVARLLVHAERAGLKSIAVGGVALRLGARPGSAAGGVPKPPEPESTATVEDIRATARPARAELHVLSLRPDPAKADALREAIAGLAPRLPSAVALVVESKRDGPWVRVAPLVAAASAALGERVVRHEIAGAP